MHILLVDDHDDLRAATRELLAALGHDVVEAPGGRRALEIADQDRELQLLATDFSMPGMDGLELAERLRRRRPDVGVLLISSHAGDARLRRRIAAGDAAFLAKPFSAVELAEAVEEAFAIRRDRTTVEATEPPPSQDGVRDDRRRPNRALRWSAAVLVLALLALALVALLRLAPGEPSPAAASGALPSTEIELIAPVGPLAEVPAELHWQSVPGAASYRLILAGTDDAVVWQVTAARSPLPLPAEVAERLLPAVAYTWAVEALDGDGRRLAWSKRIRFRVLQDS